MKVRRIVTNIDCKELDKAKAFYGDFLGLNVPMNYEWIKTFGSSQKITAQVSLASESGSGTAVQELRFRICPSRSMI